MMHAPSLVKMKITGPYSFQHKGKFDVRNIGTQTQSLLAKARFLFYADPCVHVQSSQCLRKTTLITKMSTECIQ